MQNASGRKTLHIAPGDSAGGSLRHALASAGRDEGVLAFRDDLSCGPIAAEEPALREDWWSFEEEGLIGDSLIAFWAAVEATSDRLVVWFSRHSAREFAFFLSWCERMGDRPYEVIDVTGRCLPYLDPDGCSRITPPLKAVGVTPTEALPALFGTERALTSQERGEFRAAWRNLKSEDAHFRVVTDEGLVSAPDDHFDECLLGCASTDWQRMARVVGNGLYRTSEQFHQVGDMMLHERLIALIERGGLVADGDPVDMRTCRVRLPG